MGVYWRAKRQHWVVRVIINWKRHEQAFKDESEARRAYAEAVAKLVPTRARYKEPPRYGSKDGTFNFGDPRLSRSFWNQVIPEPNSGCWLWLGSTDKAGYGSSHGKLAHRTALSAVEPLIPGLTVDHKCCVTNCVNPAHLQQVTNAVNSRLARTRRTHCKRGHEFTEENTYKMTSARGFPLRRCRACLAITYAARKARAENSNDADTRRKRSGERR
jgi:hypothetical protein